jgi:hypothetical protein
VPVIDQERVVRHLVSGQYVSGARVQRAQELFLEFDIHLLRQRLEATAAALRFDHAQMCADQDSGRRPQELQVARHLLRLVAGTFEC